MIRNVVMVKLRPGHDEAVVAGLIPQLQALDCPGTLAYTVGMDLGLKEGAWSLAIVADFVDEAAYRGYDLDEEHNRLRAVLATQAGQIARVQFRL